MYYSLGALELPVKSQNPSKFRSYRHRFHVAWLLTF